MADSSPTNSPPASPSLSREVSLPVIQEDGCRICRDQMLFEIVLVWLVFIAHAGWPVPDVNEPHYLGKARHYWDAGWCPHDFFLDSADSHQVFYLTAGWLSRWVSLEAFAWCGRLVTWGLLAWAWRRLSFALVPRPWWSVFSAALFVALNEHFHMAGEWIVGGFEAKGFSYVLVFLALAELLQDRWNRAWLLLGAASAFHVLVGGWATVAAGFCWLTLGSDRPRLMTILPGLIGGLVLALPGILPGLALTWGVSKEIRDQAAEIYVYQRLKHHLTLLAFPWENIARLTVLLGVWLLLCRSVPTDGRIRRLRGVVFGAVAISVVGAAISVAAQNHEAWGAELLRFYWFRLSDAMLPLGVALSLVALVTRQQTTNGSTEKAGRPPPAVPVVMLVAASLLVIGHFGEIVWLRCLGLPPRADKSGKVVDYADWREACRWANEKTFPTERFLTPRGAQTFKWYAGRSEVLSWKDIPQDSKAIVEWWRQMKDIYGSVDPSSDSPWVKSLALRSESDLRRLGKEYRADFLLTEAEPRLALKEHYRNNSYAIYALRENVQSASLDED